MIKYLNNENFNEEINKDSERYNLIFMLIGVDHVEQWVRF